MTVPTRFSHMFFVNELYCAMHPAFRISRLNVGDRGFTLEFFSEPEQVACSVFYNPDKPIRIGLRSRVTAEVKAAVMALSARYDAILSLIE